MGCNASRSRLPHAAHHTTTMPTARTVPNSIGTRGKSALGVTIRNAPFRLRSAIVYSTRSAALDSQLRMNLPVLLDTCVFASSCVPRKNGALVVRNCIFFEETFGAASGRCQNSVMRVFRTETATVEHCTVAEVIQYTQRGRVVDSIVGQLDARGPDVKIEHCDVFVPNGYLNGAKPGKGCFTAAPQFRDPKNFDYRLKKTSPCRGKASDGGDVGCRYTPEMMEVLKKALELRKKGIIEF